MNSCAGMGYITTETQAACDAARAAVVPTGIDDHLGASTAQTAMLRALTRGHGFGLRVPHYPAVP